jgi:hypothetical protein
VGGRRRWNGNNTKRVEAILGDNELLAVYFRASEGVPHRPKLAAPGKPTQGMLSLRFQPPPREDTGVRAAEEELSRKKWLVRS